MLKYTDAKVVFSEIPDEITLAIELSNCPFRCPACHSKYLWEDIGDELDIWTVAQLIDANQGISCICFMGGDNDLQKLFTLFDQLLLAYPELKIAWYTGRDTIPQDMPKIAYVKVGPYKEECGPINIPTTNQRFYVKGEFVNKMDANHHMYYDKTDLFWNNNGRKDQETL